jgi:tetratricopeptide (TPR) repeat protein
MTRGVYLTTQFSVVTTYLRLLVLPVNQNLDYEYPLNHSLLEPRAILSLFLLLALVAAAVKLWRIKSSSEFRVPSPESRLFRLAAFGIFWFFLTLSVESSIIPIRDVMFEHRLYLPSVGFLIAGVSLVLVAAQRLSVRFSHAGTAAALILCLAALVLAGATFARNSVWRTEETLWKDSIRKSPGKARPWNNLGVTLAKQKRLTEAIHAMETAVRLDPYYLDGRLNLGQAYAEAERFTDAERELRIAAGLSLPGDNAAREALQELHRVLAARRALLRRNEEP